MNGFDKCRALEIDTDAVATAEQIVTTLRLFTLVPRSKVYWMQCFFDLMMYSKTLWQSRKALPVHEAHAGLLSFNNIFPSFWIRMLLTGSPENLYSQDLLKSVKSVGSVINSDILPSAAKCTLIIQLSVYHGTLYFNEALLIKAPVRLLSRRANLRVCRANYTRII